MKSGAFSQAAPRAHNTPRRYDCLFLKDRNKSELGRPTTRAGRGICKARIRVDEEHFLFICQPFTVEVTCAVERIANGQDACILVADRDQVDAIGRPVNDGRIPKLRQP
jgi:hypothetical protein